MPILNVAVPAALWLWLAWHLHFEWSLNAQYNYGWAVPFLGLFLFYLRWQQRPAAERPSFGSGSVLIRCAILAVLFPVRVVEEANPDWRLLGWGLALLVAAYSLATIYELGGRKWLSYFAFPICFPFVAVPWPVQMENSIVQAMTGAVAYCAVEFAGWVGIGAYRLGNVIQLGNGFVGVDEACSGVKTFQAAIMVTLFLGEVLQLPRARRGLLLLCGCLWVFACNVFRATVLVMIAARSGIPTMQRWHDPIGIAVLILGMGGLAGAALFLQARVTKTSAPRERSILRSPALAGSVAGLMWLGLLFLATEWWYRAHEGALVARPPWSATWPDEARPVPIAEATSTILRFNNASSASWRTADAAWWGFFSRWQPGRAARGLVRSHSPEICLPAIGRTFMGERQAAEFSEGELHLRFRVYEFVQESRPLFVFVCIEEDKHASNSDDAPATTWSARGRIAAALHGQRNLGQRMLELAVLGARDASEARASLSATAHEVIRPTD